PPLSAERPDRGLGPGLLLRSAGVGYCPFWPASSWPAGAGRPEYPANPPPPGWPIAGPSDRVPKGAAERQAGAAAPPLVAPGGGSPAAVPFAAPAGLAEPAPVRASVPEAGVRPPAVPDALVHSPSSAA